MREPQMKGRLNFFGLPNVFWIIYIDIEQVRVIHVFLFWWLFLPQNIWRYDEWTHADAKAIHDTHTQICEWQDSTDYFLNLSLEPLAKGDLKASNPQETPLKREPPTHNQWENL